MALVNGTSGADTLVDTSGDDTINGLAGNDTINGGRGGNDVVNGGDGRDSLAFTIATSAVVVDFVAGTVTGGGSGTTSFTNIEKVVTGDFNDRLTGNAAAQNLTAQRGDDTLWGAGGIDTLWGGAGADTFIFRETGTANADALGDWTSGMDTVLLDGTIMTALGASGDFTAGDSRFWASSTGVAHDADDRIIFNTTTRQVYYDADGNGSAAAQLIATLQSGATLVATDIAVEGGSSSGPIVGTEGNDTLTGTPGDDTINGLGGNDRIDGNAGSDLMDGGSGNDWLRGGDGEQDTLLGGDGDDTLHGGRGSSETMDGGLGDDLYLVDSFSDSLTDAGGIDSVTALDTGWTLAAGFENLHLDKEGPVLTTGIGNALDNRMSGAGAVRLEGRGGNDTLEGSAMADELLGGAGNDSLWGGDGADTFIGGDGNDTLASINSPDDGDDFDVETLDGGLGDDRYIVDNANDVLIDAGGIDTVQVWTMDWTLGAGFENLILSSGPTESSAIGIGNELDNHMLSDSYGGELHGREGNDTLVASDVGAEHQLFGDAGDDLLLGGASFDVMNGGTGNDVLTGGDWADTFVVDVMDPGGLADTITDYVWSAGDTIRLDATVMPALGATGRFAFADARFAANSTGTAQDASDRVVYNTSSGELWYDGDGSGSGAAQLIATLQGAPTLHGNGIEVVNGVDPINGTPGDDSLTGTDGDDTMNGLGGNDTIDARGGNDLLVGGSGADSMLGGDGNDTLGGTWFGSSETTGEEAVDTMEGGLGDDVYHVDNPNDVLSDTGGVDTVRAIETDWTLGEGFENLVLGNDVSEGSLTGIGNELANRISVTYAGSHLEGHGGNDTLIGGSAQNGNRLFGGDGDDRLVGANNEDLLDGGAGRDTLSGGDVYRFSAAPGAANADQVLSFNSDFDQIQLDGRVHAGIGFNGRFAENDGRFHSAAGASAGHDADDRVVYDTSTGNLWYDADGSGAGEAQLIATLPVGAALVATDIEVINAGGLVIQGTAGNDSLTGTTSNDTINGLAGNDTLDGGVGADSMTGGAGNDLYFVDDEGDQVIELANGGIDEVRPDVWHSYTLPDWVENLTLTTGQTNEGHGNALDNVLTDAFGSRALFGSDGNDTLVAAGDGDWSDLWGERGNDSLVGGAGSDILFGGDGNDTIAGGDGGDDIWMSFFSDRGEIGLGFDIIDGGAGYDRLSFSTLIWQGQGDHGRVSLDLASGTYETDAGSGTVANIEQVSGSAYGDQLSGNALSNLLAGSAGDDTLDGGGGRDTLDGGSDADTFVFAEAPGVNNADGITAFETGTDTVQLDAAVMSALGISGRFSADDPRFWSTTFGGGHDADDRVIYNTATGQLWYDEDGVGGVGAQLILDIAAQGLTIAATDIVVVNGSAPGNVINGTSGADTLTDTAGNDTINGLAGNDTINGGHGGNDVVNGGDGRDSLVFMTATSPVVVDFGAGTVTGGGSGTTSFTNIEKVVTGDFNDTLTGNAAAQNLTAQRGSDTLAGAGGVDTLWGGAGADTFIFRETGTANADTIGDWTSGSDEFALDNSVLTGLGADGAFVAGDARFWASSTGAAHDASDRVIYNTTTRGLYYDADGTGSGAAQLIATVQVGATIAATDISVI